MYPCGNGTLRKLVDSCPLTLPPSQIPYLALVAENFVAFNSNVKILQGEVARYIGIKAKKN